MFIRLLAAFIIVPLIELYLLLQLSEATSLATTLLIVIVTGVIGSMLARRQGVLAWHRFRSAMADGKVPSREIQDGLMIVFAAALLLTPGLLTDFMGFSLLLPIGRDFFRRVFLARYAGNVNVQFGNASLNPPPVDGHSDDRATRVDTIDAVAVERKSP